MTEVQKLILEIENDAKELLKKVLSIDPARAGGHIQQKAIIGMQNGIRGQLYCEIGEVKNAFGIGLKQELEGKKKQ